MPHFEPLDSSLTLTIKDSVWIGRFKAMASPCEVLMKVRTRDEAETLLKEAANETWRIEQKFSRYLKDGIIPRINESNGKPIELDPESASLIDYAYQIYDLSDGLFDISSGVLRKVWQFKEGTPFPSKDQVAALLPYIGLEKAKWESPNFSLPAGMQIDFGGIGKEYAVDRSCAILRSKTESAFMLNYGGDIFASPGEENSPLWKVGIESSPEILEIQKGGLATSGTTHRYITYQGKRYSHVLNPKTGWPIENAPLSVTVAADSCTQAGMLATLAMLQGPDAEDFLRAQDVIFRSFR